MRNNKLKRRVWITTCFFSMVLCIITFFHQNKLGYGFDFNQVLDGKLHHEHFILLFFFYSLAVISVIMLNYGKTSLRVLL